jgi:dihydroxy-acid dehydratase
MDHKVIDKSRLPSRHTTVGPQRAPHRSYLYAMGLDAKQIAQPLVGVASCWNEAAPCNISLMRQAQVVKKGVAAANGTPREWHCHGSPGHESFACIARSHRRLG